MHSYAKQVMSLHLQSSLRAPPTKFRTLFRTSNPSANPPTDKAADIIILEHFQIPSLAEIRVRKAYAWDSEQTAEL
eukprot:c36809_g1_i1 orf=3-227(-)